MGEEQMTVTIDWLLEEIERGTDPDIIDTHCFPTLAEARAFAMTCELPTRLGLVRDRGNDLEGLLDRQWAYVEDGKLPEYFDGGILVPAKFHKELEQ
jgi:hypothetical protein